VQVVEDVGAAVDSRGECASEGGEMDRFGHSGVSVQRGVFRRGKLEVTSWEWLVGGVVKVVNILPCVRASQFSSMAGLGRPTYWRCDASDTMYRVPLGKSRRLEIKRRRSSPTVRCVSGKSVLKVFSYDLKPLDRRSRMF
jgi:hypothetical protein